jgi:hypothetical protein
MNTTAGSYALLGSVVPGDATVAAKLRKAGAILLGKANLVGSIALSFIVFYASLSRSLSGHISVETSLLVGRAAGVKLRIHTTPGQTRAALRLAVEWLQR